MSLPGTFAKGKSHAINAAMGTETIKLAIGRIERALSQIELALDRPQPAPPPVAPTPATDAPPDQEGLADRETVAGALRALDKLLVELKGSERG